MRERLPEDYITKALQDARRFSGTYDQGTSGSLAAHTHRLINERRDLLDTIDDLERRNADLRAEADRRISVVPASVPPAFAATLEHIRVVDAQPMKRAEFKPTLVSSTMPIKQATAAWNAIKAKSQSVRQNPAAIRTEVIAAAPDSGPRLVGISGRAGSGKNTVAAMIPGAAVMQLADPIYAAVAAMLGMPEAALRQRTTKEAPLPGLDKTPRQLLQTLGTEWGRETVSEDIWIRMAERHIDRLAAAGVAVVAIADVRFENEAEWIRARGGQVWHVYRDGSIVDTHASERGVQRGEGDAVIMNTGTLDDLRRAVNAAFAA